MLADRGRRAAWPGWAWTARPDGPAVLATWLVVLLFLTLGIGRYYAYLQDGGLALLGVTALVLGRRAAWPGIRRAGLAGAVLAAITAAYLAARPWPSPGAPRSYDIQALHFVVTYLAVCLFAALFYREDLFVRVYRRAATGALWIAVACCLASLLTGLPVLVSQSHGALRLSGTMTEPSAWAPVLTSLVLLALRHRAWLPLLLAGVGMVMAASPVCLLVLAGTVPAYYLLTGTWRQRVAVLLALCAVIPAAVLFVQASRPGRYIHSHNAAEAAVGRLLSGIDNVESDGRSGHNTRFASTRAVISAVRADGLIVAGAGPAADITYFRAEFPSGDVQPHALWVTVLFDFGAVGVALLAILMLTAVWRMRARPLALAVLLPFFVASLINSAEEAFGYQFVVLGIVLFAFGWAQPSRAAGNSRGPLHDAAVGPAHGSSPDSLPGEP